MVVKSPPAITQLGNNWVEYGAANFPHLPIEELVKKDAEGKKLLAGLPAEILKLGRVDGKQVAMPWSLSNPVLYYNEDLFVKAGLNPAKPPRTWVEVREAARTIKEKTGNYGLYLQEPGDFWGGAAGPDRIQRSATSHEKRR
jgi:multiple sugar transport system substrate-binding protein